MSDQESVPNSNNDSWIEGIRSPKTRRKLEILEGLMGEGKITREGDEESPEGYWKVVRHQLEIPEEIKPTEEEVEEMEAWIEKATGEGGEFDAKVLFKLMQEEESGEEDEK